MNLSPSLTTRAGHIRALERSDHEFPWLGMASAAQTIGVPLSELALAQLGRYRDLLLQRNAEFNLTAVREASQVERRLFLDAIAMLPAIDHFIATRARPGTPAVRLIDIGSGGGFPGLVLKITRPELDVTLLDATAKKVAFLTDVIADLNLRNVRAIHGRAEDKARDPRYRDQFDLATARAVAPLPILLELVMPFLDIGGEAFLPKGVRLDDELEAGRRAAVRLSSQIISADALMIEGTRLVVARKLSLTPKAYPRRTGVPSRQPLGGGA